jgi:hypothetical protein
MITRRHKGLISSDNLFIPGQATINMAEKRSLLDQISRFLEASAKIIKSDKAISGAVITALLGGILKLGEITATFPPPADLLGNVIIFAAVLFVVADACKGGLFD